ncbi:putative structural maintenance of chromosome (SMC) family protein [Trypanosoma conorhini]|uniref:Putative structural maintenance of chromosome (SMC) family protein n=1 Tax=Trypanosoma conorhini TaxID=83891 RepID=A0A422QCC7_9TRYP|nr:putative structural maintenance of chromosome (SMC) family protein [Trypanosoma conorhini]RNF27640.1 putative structural maintenance of chromosome (SMC) family protein [Trypanosoma conorhini]
MHGRIAVMKKDMQDAIHEIESLMGQLGQANDSNNSNGVAADSNAVELQRLQEEVGQLRTENERLQTKLRLVKASEVSPEAASAGAFLRTSGSADRSRASPPNSRAPQLGNKVLTLKQLKQTIEDIYASKSKYDIKCSESHLPRETMEQHMYTYLNQRYGLKHLILDWATAIIQGIKKYNLEDNDVAVFGKIIRNEIDEEFRFVQRQVRETVHELLRVYLKGKRPSKSDAEINKLVQKKTSGALLEDEWVDIVRYMYNTEDAVSIIMRVRDHLRQLSQPRRRSSVQRGHEIASVHDVQLPYAELICILLDFQLEGHERFLARFHAIFCRHDADRNGIISAQEFAAVLRGVDASKTDEEINALLELIDPFGNQLITYSECVTFLSAEIVRMMKPAA